MGINDFCFVCKKPISTANSDLNKEVYLRVCNDCKNTEEEKKRVTEYLEDLAEGFVCGCI